MAVTNVPIVAGRLSRALLIDSIVQIDSIVLAYCYASACGGDDSGGGNNPAIAMDTGIF